MTTKIFSLVQLWQLTLPAKKTQKGFSPTKKDQVMKLHDAMSIANHHLFSLQ